jgi:hypothetical protein
MDSPEAIIGIAAGIVASVAAIGVVVVRVTCPRVFAAHFGTRVPTTKPRTKPRDSAVLEISQNPMIVYPRPHASALPREVDIESILKIRRLKQEFKAAPLHKWSEKPSSV